MAENGGTDCDFPLARERFWATASRPQHGLGDGEGMRAAPPIQLNLGRQVSAPPLLQSPSPKAQLTALSIPSVPATRDGEQQGTELQVRANDAPGE